MNALLVVALVAIAVCVIESIITFAFLSKIDILLQLIQSLQKRVDNIESDPHYTARTVEVLGNRVEYLEKKRDELVYELRVIHSVRDSLLAKLQVLDEQNKILASSLEALRK